MTDEPIRQAVILVGGKGTRLGAIAHAVPKPMLPIAGDRPFVDYLLEMIERHGYRDIILLAGHLGDAVEAAYDRRQIGQAAVRVMREPVPLGTAGALTAAREVLDARFLLMNGDAFFDINLRALEQASRRFGATATLALRAVADAARYGRVIEEDGRLKAFLEKDLSRPGPGVINGGVYVLKREILDLIHDSPCSLEQQVFPALIERGEITGREFKGYFLDIGLPETLEQGHLELPNVRRRPAVFLDRDALVDMAASDSTGPGGFCWMAGAAEAVRTLNDHGRYVFVVGDASGPVEAPGAVDDACRLNARIQEHLAPEGAHIDRFYAADRGPFSNVLAEAMYEWPIVRERSVLVTKTNGEVDAARRAGLAAHIFDGNDLARLVHSLLAENAPSNCSGGEIALTLTADTAKTGKL
jgi:D-glycero-D-manno-heptose 1,7-bisphosphate phosphatase